MKKIIIASLLAVGLAAGIAYGHGKGNYHGGGHHMTGPRGMGSGNCAGYVWSGVNGFDIDNQEFLEATVSLHRQLHLKRFEFMEASRNAKTPPAQLAELEKEIIDLGALIEDKAAAPVPSAQ